MSQPDDPVQLIALIVLAAILGCLYGWWWVRRWSRSGGDAGLGRAMGTDKLPKRRMTAGERVFNLVVVAGVVSCFLAVVCWQVFSIGDVTTIFFAVTGVVCISAWPIFGRRF